VDLRAIIDGINREEDQRCVEELRTIENRKQPYLSKASVLSNLMAGLQGNRNQTPENLEAYEEAHAELRKLDQEALDVQHRKDTQHQRPIDPAPILDQAKAQLEEEKRVMAYAASMAFQRRSSAEVAYFEQARKNVAALEAAIEACELALEAQEVNA
jgi:hypothetical protein